MSLRTNQRVVVCDEQKLARLVGAALRAARLRAGLSQSQVAALLGSPREVVARTEAGGWYVPTLRTAYEHALAVKLDVRELGPILDKCVRWIERKERDLIP